MEGLAGKERGGGCVGAARRDSVDFGMAGSRFTGLDGWEGVAGEVIDEVGAVAPWTLSETVGGCAAEAAWGVALGGCWGACGATGSARRAGAVAARCGCCAT